MSPIHQLALSTLVVRDYNEAIRFFIDQLGFHLIADRPLEPGKRWVVVAPDRSGAGGLLLARAVNAAQQQAVGQQTGGRVAFFLTTADFETSYQLFRERGVQFCEVPRHEPYGTVAVFLDLYGNRWDLIQPSDQAH
jgi:catechol 2,3-dioxygenase-like lactoylglutathione lyase family enzyme